MTFGGGCQISQPRLGSPGNQANPCYWSSRNARARYLKDVLMRRNMDLKMDEDSVLTVPQRSLFLFVAMLDYVYDLFFYYLCGRDRHTIRGIPRPHTFGRKMIAFSR